MSSMEWYLQTESKDILPADDQLSEGQSAEQGANWTLWNCRFSDDLSTASVCSGKNGKGASEHQKSNQPEKFAVPATPASSGCNTRPSEDQSEVPSPLELQYTELTNDIFLSQFSAEEMSMMDAPFQALDMFPDSMHRLLTYEDLLSGICTNFMNQEANLDQNEMDTMDTCGFPLFSHDLQDDQNNAESSSPSCVNVRLNSSDILVDPSNSKDKAQVISVERADTESSQDLEAAVLEELEDVVFQLTKKARVCLRDAFYRLAERTNTTRATAVGARSTGSDEQSFQQSESIESRVSASDLAERDMNVIDRTVALLAFTK